MTAFLPAQLLYVASQFAATDDCKQTLTGIMVRPAKDGGIQIESTDGIRAFQVICSDSNWRCDAPMLLSAKAFKKRIPYARFAAFEDNETARILGGKGPTAEFLQAIPAAWKQEGYKGDPVQAYPRTEQLWPDKFGRDAHRPIAFNAQLMGDFLAQVARFSWNGTAIMERNGPHNPIVLRSTIRDTWLEDVEMRFLLMSVQIRE